MSMINDAFHMVYRYLLPRTGPSRGRRLWEALQSLAQDEILSCSETETARSLTYRETQDILARLNERESVRKSRGVYYTPADTVEFIVQNSCRLLAGKSGQEAGKEGDGPGGGPGSAQACSAPDRLAAWRKQFCGRKTVFDPTCGAGEFLLCILEEKCNLWDRGARRVTKAAIEKITGTLYGNDINQESVAIAKLRLFLCAANRYGFEKCRDLPSVLNNRFTHCNYVENPPAGNGGFDLIVGNPPYVEDSKSGLHPARRYGNIYANVLVNAAGSLKKGGVMGFVVPLSYVSTPRMKALREDLYRLTPTQYILSYSDRPDCLFVSVHQKLCILFGQKHKGPGRIYTGNYQYWYREERAKLFSGFGTVENRHVRDGYIPKIGTPTDARLYVKATAGRRKMPFIAMTTREGEAVYLNMRAAFWIKAFRNVHEGAEYRAFYFDSGDRADYAMCLLNSSLFWWYWICVSDCWHITGKELSGFMVPQNWDRERVRLLAGELEESLERTREYVGTVQTEYEYKHRLCLPQITNIDDYINGLYGLTGQESAYVKNFARTYRVSGGAANEGD